MNEHEQTIREIERLERWLASFPTPGPDEVTVARVKSAVRRAVAGGDAAADRMTRRAVAATKLTVRNEIEALGSTARPIAFRPWAPLAVAAAAIAFAFVTIWTIPGGDPVTDPELAAFVEVMTREDDAVTTELLNLEEDLTLLTGHFADDGDRTSPSLLNVGDLLEDVSNDVSVDEQEI